MSSHPHHPTTRDAAATPATTPMTRRFKDGCWDLHQTAEAGELPKRLLKGELGRDEYAVYLGQALLLSRELDERVREAMPSVPALRSLVDDAQLQAPYLEEDLATLGVEPSSVEPLPETTEAIQLIADAGANDPLALLGLHYVREGANNGNRFVAKKVREAMGFQSDAGTRYLDPYGEDQPRRWQAFKQTLDEQEFTAEERDRLVEAARSMFKAVMAVHQGVSRGIAQSA